MTKTKVRRNGTLRRIIGFLEYLLLFVIIVECNSMYTFTRQTDKYTDMQTLLTWLALVLSLGLVTAHIALCRRRIRDIRSYAPFWFFLVLYALAFYFLNARARSGSSREDYIINFVVLLPLLTLLIKIKQIEGQGADLLYKHADVACVIAAVSLLVYLSSIFHVNAMPSDPIYTKWSNLGRIHERINLLNVCLFYPGAKWPLIGIPLLRNNGFYVEPLMFSIPLITALSTELFLRAESDRYRYYRALLLTFALISANATICMALAVAVWGLKGVSVSVRRQKRALTVLLIVAIAASCALLVLQKKALRYESVEIFGSSIADHIEDYRASFRAFLKKPLLGGGYRNEHYIRKFMSAAKASVNPGLSNSAGVILGQGGLMLGLLCFTPFLTELLYAFRKRDMRIALWAIGPLGLFVGVIYLYHIYLLFILAFGYSLVEIGPVPGARLPFRLGLADIGPDGAKRMSSSASERQRRRARWVTGVLVVAGALLVGFGVPVWRWVHAFLRTHQFSLSQSPLKAFALGAVLVFHGHAIRCAARRELDWKRLIALAVWDAAYLLLYPRLFSDAVTLLTANGLKEQTYECAALLGVYFAGALLVENVRVRAMTKPRGIAAVAALVVCVAGLCVAAQAGIGRLAAGNEVLGPVLEQVTEAASGRVYASDLPSVAHRINRGASLSTTGKSGYEVMQNASVVCKRSADRTELFEAGFEVAQLSDKYLVYTNDERVISTLSGQGVAFYRYYPFEKAVDLDSLAKKNGLKQSKNGALVIGGGGRMLRKGPLSTLKKGQYTLYYELSIYRRNFGNAPDDTRVGTLRVTRYSGEEIIAEKEVTLGDFDENGRLTVGVPFKLSTITPDVEYKLAGTKKYPVRLQSLKLAQTPEYITVTTYNCHSKPIREEYFAPDGTRYIKAGGFAAIGMEYDLSDRVMSMRYYGESLAPVVVNGNCAAIRYTYNYRGMRTSEAFFDAEDRPMAVKQGYAKRTMEYDSYGNLSGERYFGMDGKPVNTAAGYAQIRRRFDDSRMPILEEYYGEDGERVSLAGGYSIVQREYDEDKRITAEYYYGTDEQPIRLDSGAAGVLYDYDGLGRVIRETYVGLSHERIVNVNGYAIRQLKYDDYGNISAEIYYDADQARTTASYGYAEIRKLYNSKGQIIRQQFYGVDALPVASANGCYGTSTEYTENGDASKIVCLDADGQPMMNTSGYAILLQIYDENRNMTWQRFLDAQERPTVVSAGISMIQKEYNDKNQNIRDLYFDENGAPTANTAGIAEVRRSFDENNNLVSQTYYDLTGQPLEV